MDPKLKGILKSLMLNVQVLDTQLMRLVQSDQLRPNEECMHMIERIRETCGSTLQNMESLERTFQSSAFVIPAEVMATLE